MSHLDLQQARLLWKENEYERAYALYEDLMKHEPDNAKVWREYGRAVYAEFDDLEKATMLFEQALSKDPASLVTLLYLGELYSSGYGERGYSAALPSFQQVLGLASEHPKAYLEALMGIGMLLNAPGKPVTYEEAFDAFRTAALLAPDNATVHSNLGTLLYEHGDITATQKEWEIAQQLFQDQHEIGMVHAIQKKLTCIRNNQPITSMSYTRNSVTSEWPDVDFDDIT